MVSGVSPYNTSCFVCLLPLFQILCVLLALLELCLCSVDEFMTCDRLLESRRSARLLDHIPCDMTKKLYCEHKGSRYPE